MDKLVIRKGFVPDIVGKPSKALKDVRWVSRLCIDPYSVLYVEPQLCVTDQQHVKRGDVLFTAKHDARICFLSPGSGVVSLGSTLLIALDKDEEDRSFSVVSRVEGMSRVGIRDALLAGGLWSSFFAYPFKRLANPDQVPPAIYVSLDNDEPFHPDLDVYLKGKVDELKLGLEVLQKLTDGPVYVSMAHGNWRMRALLARIATHEIVGAYPANDPGVFLYHNKGSAYENTSWGIRGEDVLRIARFFREGIYPDDRVIVLGGSVVKSPMHFRVRQGMILEDLLYERLNETPAQIILGGVFRGKKVTADSSIGYGDDAVQVIEAELVQKDLLPLQKGDRITSYSRGFLSSFLKRKSWLSVKSFGESQHCIQCDLCSDVCPVELLPQNLVYDLDKQHVAGAVKQGLLDCVSCGLCTYVCPSKLDLGTSFNVALDQLLEGKV